MTGNENIRIGKVLKEFNIGMGTLVEFLKKKLKNKYTENLVITTGYNNDLKKFADDNNIKTFEVPVSVGGRFSVLSPVGLLPIAVMGVDLGKLIEGAKEMLEHSKN